MPETKTIATDPVCGMTVDGDAAIVVAHAGVPYYFCDDACAETFRDDPERWVSGFDPAQPDHAHH